MELRIGTMWQFKAFEINDTLIVDSFDHNGRVRTYWKSSPNNYMFCSKQELLEDFKQVSSLELELT